jgi:hypothetical protein
MAGFYLNFSPRQGMALTIAVNTQNVRKSEDLFYSSMLFPCLTPPNARDVHIPTIHSHIIHPG